MAGVTLEQFVRDVRDGLSLAGLPVNLQPPHASLVGWAAWGATVEQCVAFYQSDAGRYERHANRGTA